MPAPKNAASPGFKAGLAMRKKVLGADYVERAMANSDDLNMPVQERPPKLAWGSGWCEPAGAWTCRRAASAARGRASPLNRPNEIKIHLRGAIRNGVTRTQIRELILHSFLYCGGPAALDAYQAVRSACRRSGTARKSCESAGKAAAAEKRRASPKRAAKTAGR